MHILTRRTALLGAACALGGCSALSSLNAAATPLDTYDLRPAAGATAGRRTSRTLLVAQPQVSAALATDRIVVKPDPASITFLPSARWSDELPNVFQYLVIRSISTTGRIGYVGPSGAGPVPDKALLVRIDAFDVNARSDGTFEVQVDVDMTIVNDRDQRVVATRRFAQSAETSSDSPKDVVAAFQNVLDALLPEISDWVIAKV